MVTTIQIDENVKKALDRLKENKETYEEIIINLMKIALVHDYLNEFGGAERVLLALSEIWPEAPIYTAFVKKGSPAYERFKNKKIVTSWAQKVPGFNKYLFSPLRFLAPLIWNSFSSRLADYDVILASSGWYVTKGFKRGDKWDKSNKGNKDVISL